MRSIWMGGIGLGLGALQVWAANTEAVNEVIKLQKAGLAKEVIVAYVQSKPVNYALGADDLIALRDQGLSGDILNAMLDASARAKAVEPSVGTTSAPAGATGVVAVPAAAAPAVVATPAPTVTAVATVPVATVPSTVVVSPAASPQSAYFYQELSPYGSWVLAEDNQWYWQPAAARVDVTWRPYWDRGHWVYTDAGWYWASDYPWGWVAFHYGRWHLHPRHGWIWYPGREWSPAWVTWRTGGDYCGWAPLPPHARFDLRTGHYLFHDRAVEVNFDFGLGFQHFSFCYTRELGDANRRRFSREREARELFGRTVVVNNYTVLSVGQDRRPMNRGIEPDRIVAHGGRQVDRVVLHDLDRPDRREAIERVDSRTKTITVYRPQWDGARPNRVTSPGPAVAPSGSGPGPRPQASPGGGSPGVRPQAAPSRPAQVETPGRAVQPLRRGDDARGSGGPGRRDRP